LTDKIPWLDRREQPRYSNDVVPMCFFQLQTIDDEDDERTTKNPEQKLKNNQCVTCEGKFENDYII